MILKLTGTLKQENGTNQHYRLKVGCLRAQLRRPRQLPLRNLALRWILRRAIASILSEPKSSTRNFQVIPGILDRSVGLERF